MEPSTRTTATDGMPWASLADQLQQRVPELTTRLVTTIEKLNPGYSALNVVPTDDLRNSCHDNIVRLLQLVGGPDDPRDEELFDAARATGTRRAAQGLPLDDVLRSFRLGGQLIWEALNDQAEVAGTVDPDTLRQVGSRLWAVVDTTSAQVAVAYHVAERRMVRVDEQRRAELWEGLLSGRATDDGFVHEAARVMDLPVDGRCVAAVIEHGWGDGDQLVPVIEQALGRSGIASAWQSRSGTTVGILHLGDTDIHTALAVLAASSEVPVGLSLVADGLAEADTAHRQATLALRCLEPGSENAVALQDRLPEAFLLRSPELSDRLVRSWLGPLLDLEGSAGGPLLETLTTWVATGGSTGRTAETLHCHRNTVINRLRKVEETLGYALAWDAVPIELSLAVRAAQLSSPTP